MRLNEGTMALRFRVEMTKTKPRVAVLRILKNEKGEEALELLGSFGLRKPPDLVRKKLTEDEQYELDNYLSALEFAQEYYQAEAHELSRLMIKIPVGFQEDLLKLAKLAKRHGLEFIPEKEMLLAALNKARKLEIELCKRTGKKINVLAKRGINIYNIDSSVTDIESKKLFEALLALGKDINTICHDFQNIAQRVYHKNASFKPHYFEYFADPANERKFPKWYYTVAIDCLLKYGINPTTVIAPPKVANHWARLRTSKLSIEEAKLEFLKTVKPPKNSQDSCLKTLELVFMQRDKEEV